MLSAKGISPVIITPARLDSRSYNQGDRGSRKRRTQYYNKTQGINLLLQSQNYDVAATRNGWADKQRH